MAPGEPALDVRGRDALWRQYVAGVSAGDPEALAKLYDESSSLVYALALRILGDAADAEEVTLDVYTQVWRTAASFDAGRGTTAAWLVTLARSRALDRLRSSGARKQKEEPIDTSAEARSEGALPEEACIMSQQRQIVRKALAELGPEQRQAIELAFYSGLSHRELAERLGQPLGTVKTRIRLGMIKLRQLLEPLVETQ